MTDAFSCDEVMQAKFLELVRKHGIRTVIETGTYKGQTTTFLAEHAPKVITIEASEVYFSLCGHLDDLPNVTRILGSSSEKVAEAIAASEGPRLYFLDAHWQSHNPLLDELAAIAAAGDNPVIIIHDFQVPGHSDLGFDMFDAQRPISLDLVEPSLRKIYGDFVPSFNDDSAGGSRRGVLIVEPLAPTAKA